MSDRDTWELTREMFLSEAEVETVRTSLRNAITDADDDSKRTRRVDQLIFEILIMSGLRNSEFCRLRISDTPVALGQPFLRVAETPRQNRLVAIPSYLVQMIARYALHERPRSPQTSETIDDLDQPLILNDRNKPLDRTTLYRRVVRILTAAGLESRASVQLLRHTYGYLAYLRTGGNLLFVQEQLGHAHPMVTAVYAKFVEFPKADLANRVAGDSITSGPNSDRSPATPTPAPTNTRKKGNAK